MLNANYITQSEFKSALGRYPALLEGLVRHGKAEGDSLVELDRFRYIDAPSRFSKKAGEPTMKLADIQKLMDWKLQHGTYRPTLAKHVASNSEETVREATTAGFSHHATNPSDIAGTLELLTKPLKGVGPATGSLLLAVHDPKNVIFFSDEAYSWLVKGGHKTKIMYKTSEFEELYAKAQDMQARLNVSPIEIEKVAYVIIKESEPPKVSTTYVPTGKPRGRPRLPDSEKKATKPTVPGRGRGRPKGTTTVAPTSPAGEPKKRGRPPGSAKKSEAADDEEEHTPSAKRAKA